MDRSGDPVVLNAAPSLADRLREAPDPARVRVDGRPPEQLLAFAAEYGRLIAFHDLDDSPAGDWREVFAGDPAIALALRAMLQPSLLEAEFRALAETLHAATDAPARLAALDRILARLFRLARILGGGWTDPGSLEEAALLLEAADPAGEVTAALREFDHHIATTPVHRRGQGWVAQAETLLRRLVAALGALLRAGETDTRRALAASLAAEGHAPHAALWIAFTRLFANAQAVLNRFPERLAAFQAAAILRQDHRGPAPDRLFLAFTPDKGITESEVPRGSRFPAGADAAHRPIEYATQRAVAVHAARIARLRMQRLVHDLPFDGAADAVPTQVLTGSLRAGEKPPLLPAPAPLFGGAVPGGPLGMAAATLGFALAGPILLLTGGRRRVRLRLTLAGASIAAATPLLTAAGARLGGLPPLAVLARVMEGALALVTSTAGGWAPVKRMTVTAPPGTAPSLEIGFTLPAGAAPLQPAATLPARKDALPPGPEDPMPDPAAPVLLARLRQDPLTLSHGDATLSVRPYALLRDIELEGLTAAVAVEGLVPERLDGPTGPLDATKPFWPFGNPSIPGATLRVAAAEIFAKRPRHLALSIDWSGLPAGPGGFPAYYAGYVVDGAGGTIDPATAFANGSFHIGLAVTDPGAWTVPPDLSFPLFQTAEGQPDPAPGQPLLATSRIAMRTDPCPEGPYADPARGALRLTLLQPAHAFGEMLYARNVMAASLRQAHDAAATEVLPNPPWTPTATGIALSYAAEAGLPGPADEARFYHLQPFGQVEALDWPIGGTIPLLPRQEAEGSLWIEFSAPAASPSLLLQLLPAPAGLAGQAPVWEQAMRDGWAPAALVADSTGGLQSTGIVSFALAGPAVGGLPCLRATLPRNAAAAPLLADIVPNAVAADWVGPGGDTGLATPLPAKTIKAPAAPLPGIAATQQPLPSFGGRPRLEGPGFRLWMAERLRHKMRGIQPWDYARLALAEFPSLWQVAVLPATDAAGEEAPGLVRVVVVPGRDSPGILDTTRPCADPGLLGALEAWLAGHVGPFVRLEVANPPYVPLRVSAELSFDAADTPHAQIERLNRELVDWLSPWPPEHLGPRPAQYWTRLGLLDFMRRRPYVTAILTAQVGVEPDWSGDPAAPRYYTAARWHDLRAALP